MNADRASRVNMATQQKEISEGKFDILQKQLKEMTNAQNILILDHEREKV